VGIPDDAIANLQRHFLDGIPHQAGGDMQRFRWTVPVLMVLTLAGVSVAHAQKTIKPQDSAWVKLCEKANAVTKYKEGNEERKEVKICLTHHERLDANSGMVLVSAAVRQIDGQDKQHFMVMVPLDMQIRPGLRSRTISRVLSPAANRFVTNLR
jgi:invasion protein IalB